MRGGIFSRRNGLLIAIVFATSLMAMACGSDAAGQPTGVPPTLSPRTPTPAPNIDFHPTLGVPFYLPVGGSAFVDARGYRITFVRIVSDNRCPLDVVCITGGAATVELAVRTSAASADRALLLSIGPDKVEPTITSVGEFTIELLEVEPVPGGSADPARVRLVVSRGAIEPLTLDARVSPSTVDVGGTFEVITDAGGAGIPQYTLWLDETAVSVIDYASNVVSPTISDRITVSGTEADMTTARWTVRADRAGTLAMKVTVNGEVSAGPDGPHFFTSGEKQLTVTVR